MGSFPCTRGHVFSKISSEEGWLSECGPKFPIGYRSSYVGNEHAEEGNHGLTQETYRCSFLQDIMAVSIPTISLSLITIPHIITPSLALSILSDLLPRLSHSSPNIRKKTVVTLYRLALVYPEALRPAWPKMEEMLMDDVQDPSVTAATINMICELSWRRPEDILPFAPRLFDLLVSGGNNWMAIKIIKLVSWQSMNLETCLWTQFTTLTPLKPRLIKKLLPPLVNLIRTTPAMSLLYECISGIIQGGILDDPQSYEERDDVAELCVSKLRGMIIVDGDPNRECIPSLFNHY